MELWARELRELLELGWLRRKERFAHAPPLSARGGLLGNTLFVADASDSTSEILVVGTNGATA
jgi:hypothetical protein